MIRFRMEIAGAAEIDRGFDRFTALIDDWSPVWEPMADAFLAIERAQFETEGAAEGDKWAPLSPAYAEWKEQHFGEMPILMRTLRLYESLTDRNSPDFVFDGGERYLTLGTRVPYAIYHQSRQPRASHLPRRPEIAFSEATKRALMKVMQMYAVQVARSFGYTNQSGDFYKSAAQLSSRYDFLVNN